MPNLAKNTSYFTLALVLQKIISLTYFTIYARALGPADLGQYYFAISITSIFSIFIDFGLGNVVTREVAKFPEKANSILSNVIAVKLPLAIVTALAIIAWANIAHYSDITMQLIYISTGAMVLDSFTGVFYAVARGFHNLKFESISSVLFQVIILTLSLFVLKEHWGISWLMGTFLAASLFNFIYSWSIIKSIWKLRVRPRLDKALIKELFAIALPFGIFVIVQRFYAYFDSVLLFKLAGDRAVGLYQVPFKISVALQFLPMAFVASLYPALSSYWHTAKEKLAPAFEQAVIYCLAIAVPVTLGTIFLAEKVVLLFTKEFTESTLLLKVSMMAVPFMFLAFPLGSLLNACDRQRRNTINMTITALVSAGLNIILIPRLGVLGACITTLITSILMLILGLVVIPSITKLHWRKTLIALTKILVSGFGMVLVVLAIKNMIHPILTIISGAVVYGALLFLLGGITKEDIMSLLHSLRSKQSSESELS